MGERVSEGLEFIVLLIDQALLGRGVNGAIDDAARRFRRQSGLGEIVGNAVAHRLGGEHFIAETGDQNDRQMRVRLAQPARQGQPVHLRHVLIEQDAIKPLFAA